MARTPMLHSLATLGQDIRIARELGITVDDVREGREAGASAARDSEREGETPVTSARPRGITRRQLLGGMAAGAGLLLLPRPLSARRQPTIAIVGGGLAGLNAALELGDRGYVTTLYEAQSLGGRVRSEGPAAPGCGNCHGVPFPVADTWADNQVTELFGEFIDTDHRTMRQLARRFGLPLTNLLKAEPKRSEDAYYFAGQRYSTAAAQGDFADVFGLLAADVKAAGDVSYAASTPSGRALDSLSVWDWIESRVDGGHASPFGQLLDVAYTIEYGAQTRDQSALNLILLLGGARKRKFSIFGSSDEKFQIEGGNQGLIRAMARAVQGSCDLRTGWELNSISQRPGGGYQLEFEGKAPATADLVLLALPFAALRRIDYARAGFDVLKDTAIRELGAAHNGKTYLQFKSRLWNQKGPWGIGNGNAYGDTGFQAAWDASRGQAGASGILCKYTGGDGADAMAINHPYGNLRNPSVAADAASFLAQIEPVFPAVGALWNGRGSGSQPHLSPFFGASYSYFRVGQYQQISGYEGVTQGGVLFAGEHTSTDYQGYMEGAAAEGARAAKEMVALIRGK